ncbi:TIGR03773 family transporter-associated surface protein [Streptomyces liangshanensis]|uniref:Cell wall protein n=1 Tax=Streptomyces liangshanensis TaxID=2717324 RepID=A0A6G9GSU1_9ACTN|nr:TIGR03773 family transporter-associated surface protein [Streptomyces liangshanensis]QIQ01081.1 hypothetical protein HA039_01120 [Streptomyces liangshanensis]
MATPRTARWAAAGVIGSVALGAGLAPAAVAGTPDGAVPPRMALSLEGDRLALDLRSAPDSTASQDTTVPADLEIGQDGTGSPAWDTSGIPAGTPVDWALTGIEGPGDLTVSEAADGPDAPPVRFDSTDGLPDVWHLPATTEGDTRWAFTRPGEYRLTSRATALLPGGGTATAETEWTVRVAAAPARTPVGPDAPTTPLPSPSAGPPTALLPGRTPQSPPADPPGAPLLARKSTTHSAAGRAASADAPSGSDAIATGRTVIDDGHVDAIAGKMVNGTLRTLFKDSRDPAHVVWREPSSVILHVNPAAKEKVPADRAYAFLGTAGKAFWLIPQVQKPGVVWAGWNTESLRGSALEGPVDLRLTKVAGPGPLAIWETAGLGGAQVLYNSADGLPDGRKVNLGVHAHANWGFAEEGVYRVTFQLAGRLASGASATDTRTYTFAVGDVDPNAVTPGTATGDGDGGGKSGPGARPGATATPPAGSGSGTGKGGPAGPDEAAPGGSLAHTGGGPALPLALGAGVLVVVGGAAITATRARRRTARP